MLDERLSSHIVHTDHFGRVKSEVIDAATGWMNPASLEALPNDLKWHVQVHHQVYLMGPVQGFSLCKGPGKTTQQSVILGDISQLLEQQPNHEVGWDELPLVREGLGQLPDFCVPSHVVSDQVPTGEGLQLEVFGNEQCQGALAGARGAHDHGVRELPRRPVAAERGRERGRPTQLLESRKHVHHEEAVVRLALHHWVQPQVHVRERCQGVEPEDLRQRGDAVVVKVEALQRRQALDALLGQTQGETGVNRHTPHTQTPATHTHPPSPESRAKMCSAASSAPGP